ncbi:ABC transporter ATP-binding protein/permease [Flammeovirga yaeyamensis]|uniref:ABC transporter ATP-binding protein/permease n=1 Tax=Flammeovirga yaeyamensis TaxID=367791 RepID=A0AAX1N4E1_9BACT|nr:MULTISPECIES: ABC transporter ATP-binding protein [Flammeovirga]ANQ50183.1 ABC transporter ATP-binding protein [Flammeovirga sp. MY04]MBB3701428.1 ATP-binding cassette subfamily B protein [Flammeovirga yaeyamensis]NMF38540.1 ABC transporter ATP-binding protein [Flammeovirga yaeyamensis]QWG02380.1 ABC transporter ATP-binding protein/permease [Flammeovirga yaeyamensis]
MKELAFLNKYIIRYGFRLTLGIIFMIISNIFAIAPAQVVRYALDLVIDTFKTQELLKGSAEHTVFVDDFFQTVLLYGGIIVLMALMRGVFLFLVRQTIIVMSRLIEYDLKNDIFEHYQKLSLSFYRKNNTGDLMARISEDVSKVRMYLGPAIMYSINMIISFILTIGIMLSINVHLTFWALFPLPLLSISIYFVNNIINKKSELIQQQLSSMSTFVQEAFSGIRVIKAFVRENESLSQFDENATEYQNRQLELAKVNSMFYPLMLFLIGLSTILTVYVGGIEVEKGTITAGVIAEFIMYVTLLTWPVTSLGWVTSIVQRAAASQKRINEFLNETPDIVSTSSEKKDIKGNLKFDKVSLVYPDSGIKALDELSFEIESGKTLAILGTTGSGKSTVANLISRLYDPSSGTIYIDGEDLKGYNLQDIRSQINMAPQDVFLFSNSLRNNISFAKTDATEEDIIQATKDAGLYENIVQMDKGLDTLVGERGITLSGGQKQRTTIARAILGNPKILVLDDSLSAVDTKTENLILNNLQRVMKNKTSVIISHRVSSAKLADKIIVLHEGKIIEEGTHNELLEKKGHYNTLFEQQSKGNNL